MTSMIEPVRTGTATLRWGRARRAAGRSERARRSRRGCAAATPRPAAGRPEGGHPGEAHRVGGRAALAQPVEERARRQRQQQEQQAGDWKLIAGPGPGGAARARRWSGARGRRRRRRCRAPPRRAVRLRPRRSARAPLWREVSTDTWRPVSGSTSVRWPTAGSSPSRGSAISTATTYVALSPGAAAGVPTPPARGSPTPRPPGPAYRHPRRGGAGPPAQSLPDRPSPSWATPVSRRRRSAQRGQAPAAGRNEFGGAGAERDYRQAAGPPQGQAAHGQRDALGHVGLQPLGRPERHRGGDVEREPCGQRALRDLEAHVGHGRPRARRGVDLADVVADLVRAQLRQLGPDPGAGGGTVAGQQPARAPREPQLHGVEQRGRHRPGPWRAAGGRSRSAVALTPPARPPRTPRPARPRPAELRHHDGEDPLEDVVGAHPVAERVVGEHEAVAQDIGGEVADVAHDDVLATAQQRQGAGGAHEPDRPARARPYST